ncbi:MAG: tryptophan 2,3-dioxygenase family protein [Gemmatimonas sp.]
MTRPRPASYWDYIRVEDLLSLQRGVDDSEANLTDDEVRFIVIHQIDELWFKVVLREQVARRWCPRTRSPARSTA